MLLPVGTTLEGRMDTTISSANSREGQRFMVVLSAPVLVGGSDVAIPAGSQIIGEVVEAIPASKFKKKKGYAKPVGKLRIQLTGLRTPDGASYPLIGSLTGENIIANHRNERNANLGGGIGYVGSQANFDAVNPTSRQSGNGRSPQVVTKTELSKNALYGKDQGRQALGSPQIRSLVLRKQDLVINSGSPVTVQLDAPFKMHFGNMAQSDAAYEAAAQHAYNTGGRRFNPDSEPTQEGPSFSGGSNSNLPFLQPKQIESPIPQTPGAVSTPPPARQSNSSDF